MPFLAGAAGVPIATAIAGALGAGAMTYGSHVQGKSANQANQIASKASDQAIAAQTEENTYNRRMAETDRAEEQRRYLAQTGRDDEQRTYARGQRSQYLDRLSPYAQAGAKAVGQLSQQTSRPLPQVSNGPMGGPAVMMRSPDGRSQRAVPASAVQALIAKGATVIG